MLVTVALQLVLPLLLLASLRFTPSRGVADLVVRALGTASVVSALHLAGLWTVLPGWLTWFYALAWGWGVGAQATRLATRQADNARRFLPP